MNKPKTILQNLNYLLKPYIIEKDERKTLIQRLVEKFENRSYIMYQIDPSKFIILTKDERRLINKKRYKKSPFPLLSNIENFSSNAGD